MIQAADLFLKNIQEEQFSILSLFLETQIQEAKLMSHLIQPLFITAIRPFKCDANRRPRKLETKAEVHKRPPLMWRRSILNL